MDQQGSTPDIPAGGQISHSPQASADTTVPQAQPSISQEPQNGDLLGNLQHSAETGNPVTDTPSQSTPETTTPQTEPQNQGQPTSGDSVAPTTPSVDPELAKWAESQNLQLNTPAEITLAKRLRDTQSALHRKNNERVQTINEDEFSDPLEQKVDTVSRQLARYQFFDTHPEAKPLEQKMIDYVTDLLDKGDKDAAYFYANNWEHLYNAVKPQTPPVDTDALVDQGRQQERANLAKAQQAAPPTAAASASAPQPNLTTEEQIAKMSQAEYNEWRKTHNPFAA